SLPRYGTPFPRRMSAIQKLRNWIQPQLTLFHFLPVVWRLQKYRRLAGAPTPIFQVYQKQLMVVSTAFGLELPRPLPPHVQMIGPIFPTSVEPLSLEVVDWLEQSTAPVIFVSFGTLASLDQRELSAVTAALT